MVSMVMIMVVSDVREVTGLPSGAVINDEHGDDCGGD